MGRGGLARGGEDWLGAGFITINPAQNSPQAAACRGLTGATAVRDVCRPQHAAAIREPRPYGMSEGRSMPRPFGTLKFKFSYKIEYYIKNTLYYSQNIIYNKFKEKNNESKRLLSAAGSSTHSFFVCVLNEKQALFTDWYPRGAYSGKHVVDDHTEVTVKDLRHA